MAKSKMPKSVSHAVKACRRVHVDMGRGTGPHGPGPLWGGMRREMENHGHGMGLGWMGGGPRNRRRAGR